MRAIEKLLALLAGLYTNRTEGAGDFFLDNLWIGELLTKAKKSGELIPDDLKEIFLRASKERGIAPEVLEEAFADLIGILQCLLHLSEHETYGFVLETLEEEPLFLLVPATLTDDERKEEPVFIAVPLPPASKTKKKRPKPQTEAEVKAVFVEIHEIDGSGGVERALRAMTRTISISNDGNSGKISWSKVVTLLMKFYPDIFWQEPSEEFIKAMIVDFLDRWKELV
ncbi:MAG: hypothetical protein ABIJ92_01170 [Candidatus Aenigmatarchaeota archaeon]